jgi:dipeptidyl aminopeptidase/acylaminoacyl peptidase
MRTVRFRPFGLIALTLVLAACDEPPPITPPQPAPAAPPATAAPALTAAPAAKPAPRADASLLPRKLLFGNPDRSMPKLSPDGKLLAFLAPDGGVLNLWVGPAADPASAKAITHEKERGIRSYAWTFSSQQIVYPQDKGGDENFHVLVADAAGGETKDLTPIPGVRAELVDVSPKHPGEILVRMNQRDPKNHDLFKIDLKTAKATLVAQNDDGFLGFTSDLDYTPRLAAKATPDGGQEMFKPDPKKKGAWVSWQKVPPEDSLTTEPQDFDKTGKTLYMIDSRGRDTAALFAVDIASGKQTLLADDPRADVDSVLVHPVDRKPQAAASTRERRTWKVLDKAIQPDFDALAKVAPGDFEVLSRTLDDKAWVVGYTLDDGPVRYYRYDRKSQKADFLFTNRKALEDKPLAKMHPVVIKSRDGLDLVSYLSLPRASDPDGDGKPAAPLPMVLLVHGGPWARDGWGLNSMHQWLASRGYAVLSVNYRASTGFGKKFTNAGDKEWASKMHNDLLDAVKWAVDGKVADAARIAIMGGSYGGYATLVGLTFTPDTFACGVDIVGPSNLVTLLSTIPPYWGPMLSIFTQRVGDHRTDDGKQLLLSRSPLTHVDAIKKPLLIGQGKNDPRVKQAESDQIVKAMQDKKIPVTYVLYPDEGHGFQRPQNRTSFNAVAETFLAQCLGGSYEPTGDDFNGSSITVPVGGSEIYGLDQALSAKK